ncbi:hypothetical protein ABIA32_000062 [Streptacidiphilus sp. MAP12-20]|uniref:DUF5819 family protein n=1 Tax=Streptacidiphilus sp. MAP12-20 TaxID=3156299 RepID=UPI0035113413
MADEPSSESIPSLPAPRPPGDDQPGAEAGDERRWSVPSLLVLGVAAVVLISAVVYHLGTVFLSVAPSNPVSQRHAATVNEHVLPEFEQNWQLFAPNPLQDDIAVEARVQTLDADGHRVESPWINLTAHDIAAIRDNPAPSHIDQNLLRRAWDYYTAWHSQQDESSTGFGGPLAVEYLKRIALQRIGRSYDGRRIIQIQFRSSTTPLTGPSWTGAPATATPGYRQLPWWPANDEDYQNLGMPS